jgi:hypothetical protein
MSLRQSILILATLLGSWLGMQAVHELGHVIGACVTGGKVDCVVLHPLTISRTDVSENPHPLFVVWAGPILGVLFPLLLWGSVAALKPDIGFLARFFAGFCLLGNGLYIGIGSFDRVGDCGEMLKHGAAIWQLWLFGLITAPMGFWLWHGQGTHFGWGVPRGEVSRIATMSSVVACATLIVLGFVVGGQ